MAEYRFSYLEAGKIQGFVIYNGPTSSPANRRLDITAIEIRKPEMLAATPKFTVRDPSVIDPATGMPKLVLERTVPAGAVVSEPVPPGYKMVEIDGDGVPTPGSGVYSTPLEIGLAS